jgi:hypothetical protein
MIGIVIFVSIVLVIGLAVWGLTNLLFKKT